MSDHVERTPSERVDVCVIGSGPAGSLVADELATSGHDVLILEAGKRFEFAERLERMERALRPGTDPLSVWEMGGARDAYRSTGEAHYPLNHSRVKGVGGTSLHWQGMVMRLHERDFELQSRHGVGRDWPISYSDLEPYYAAAESAFGVAGASDNPFSPPRTEPYPMDAFPPSHSDSIFAEACESLGVTMHSSPNARTSEAGADTPQCVGYGTCKPVCPSGAKYDATRHVDSATRAGARLIDRAPVQRLEHDDAGDQIEAAVYATPDGNTHRQTARQFVVACGGVETPRLLLCSDSKEYPDGLGNSSGAVGRYFMEHLGAVTAGMYDEPTRQNQIGFFTSETHQFYDDPTQGTEQGIPARDAEPGELNPIKLEFFNDADPDPVTRALEGEDWGDALRSSLQEAYGNTLAMGGLVGQLPQKDNYIGLDSSRTDDHGKPVPEVHWSIDERTKRTVERANEIQEAILSELGVDVSWQVGPGNTGPAFHHMGTTRMGSDPSRSVVDARLQAHDLENCWLVGSSVFVTSGAMNPTLTIGALALKAANHIESGL